MQSNEALMFITPRPGTVFVRGEGSWLYDEAGRAWLDFVQGWAVNTLGHASPVMRAALAAQAAKVINVSPAYWNAPMAALAARLASHSGLDRVFFANSGAEANEGAIKLARKWGAAKRGGAHEIIVFEDAFHGRTLATMSASGKPGWDRLYEPKVPGFVRVPRNDLAAVEAAIGPRCCAVLLEPIQGESGVQMFDDGFLRDLRELTRARGVLLMLDEIQTGVGRTGRMFGCEWAGIVPDVMTLAKGLGGGVPLAALLAREAASLFVTGDQGGTFNGNPLMTAVGLAVIDAVAAPGFLESVRANGEHLAERLSAYGPVRGRGLLLALELPRPVAAQVVEAAHAEGLLINAPRSACLRFMPALNVTRAEIDEMLARLGRAMDRVG